MHLSSVTAALAFTSLLLIVPVAQAQAQAQDQQIQDKIQDRCENDDGAVSLDAQISACTALIRSGKAKPASLAGFYTNRGVAYVGKAEFGLALRDQNEAIRLDPTNPHFFMNRGATYQAQRQYDLAVEDYTRSLALDPSFVHALSGRCWSRAIVGRDLRGALADCNEALRLTDDNIRRAVLLRNRGIVYTKLDEFDLAIADYNAVIGLVPPNAVPPISHGIASALYGRGYVKLKRGDATGKADIAKAKTIQRNIADIYTRYGLKQ